jgi:hypothetical protein
LRVRTYEIYTFPLEIEGEKQRWVSISELSKNDFTFPIDKIVSEKIKEIY